MVTQHLTPELTQPNVLVEVDPGPPMRLHHKAQGPAPGLPQARMPQSMSPAEREHALVTNDVCPRYSLGYGGVALVETEGPWMHPIVIAMQHSNFDKDRGLLCPFYKRSHLKVFYQCIGRFQFHTLHHFGLRQQVQLPEAARRLPDSTSRQERDSTMEQTISPSFWRSPETRLERSGVVSVDCALKDQTFIRAGNIDTEIVVDGTQMVRASKLEKPLYRDRLMQFLYTEWCKKPQYTGWEDTGDIERPLSMSRPTGAEKNFNVDAAYVLDDVFMWLIEYNLVASPREMESLLRLSNQATELLLNLAATAVSCLHALLPPPVERTARDNQWTEEVHCLLDDPG